MRETSWFFCLFFYLFSFSPLFPMHQSLEKIFTDVFKSNIWAYGTETISGSGASLSYTENMRKDLIALLKKYKVKTILDLGCGDFNWMQHVITEDITYIGIDVVKEIIDSNKQKYENSHISFIHGEITSALLPQVDLIICRDIIAHLSYYWARKLLKNIQKSSSKYILLTSYNGEERINKDLSEGEIGVGNYVVNMQKAPFSLGPPLEFFNERCPLPYHNVVPDKILGLWYVDDLDKGAAAVTYLSETVWGGRLGDQLLMYIKAKWIAYKYGMQFYYKPFKYSDCFMLHELEKEWRDQYCSHYKIIEDPYENIEKPNFHSIELDHFIDTSFAKLHIINYYFQPPAWGDYQASYDSQNVSEWVGLYEDSCFRDFLRTVLKPRVPVKILELPEDRITVAVHVRKGGGYDGDIFSLQLYGDSKDDSKTCVCCASSSRYTDIGYKLKFPPDQFYVDQIRYLSNKYNDAPMYVHVFTDDRDPQALIDRYAAAVSKSNVIYGCRQTGNHYDCNVIDDLFNMIRFDCLIRSGSNFPQVVQLLGDFKVVLYPRHAQWRSILHIYDVGKVEEAENN